MMSLVIVNGDKVQFNPQFGNRTILLPITTISGTGHATIGMKKVCVKGDETRVTLNTQYTTPMHTVPGNAVVTIKKLDTGQLASDCVSPTGLITLGQSPFKAELTVTKPAQMPPPANTPDATSPSDGSGMFIASQFQVNAG